MYDHSPTYNFNSLKGIYKFQQDFENTLYLEKNNIMRNILFVQPPSNMQKLQNIKSRNPEIKVPLPFVCISPYLLNKGFNVEIIDLRIDNLDILRIYLEKRKPVFAGMSIMPGNALPIAIKINNFIKNHSPE